MTMPDKNNVTQPAKKRIKCRVGDIISIPIDDNLYAFARIINNNYLAIFSNLSSIPTPAFDWKAEPFAYYTAYVDKAVRTGEWPIIGHFDSDSIDNDWAPPMCIRNPFPPREVKYIIDRGVTRPATDDEAQGLDEFTMQPPLGVVVDIEKRLLGRESIALARFRESCQRRPQGIIPEYAPFSNDDAFELLVKLEKARNDLPLQKMLVKAAKTNGYLESPPSKMAIAAAEAVAAGFGEPCNGLPEQVSKFLARVGPLNDNLIDLASSAVHRVATDSELRDLWMESKHFTEWKATLSDLQSRLESARKRYSNSHEA